MNLDEKKSHATTIAVMLPLCAVSALIYALKIKLDWLMLLFVACGFILGGVLGAILLKKLNNKVVRIIFAAIVLAAGIRMVIPV